MFTNSCAVFFCIRFNDYDFLLLNASCAAFRFRHLYWLAVYEQLSIGWERGKSPLSALGLFVDRNPKSLPPIVFGIIGYPTNSNMRAENVVLDLSASLYEVVHIGVLLSRLEVALLTYRVKCDTFSLLQIFAQVTNRVPGGRRQLSHSCRLFSGRYTIPHFSSPVYMCRKLISK